jgi:Phasin protein
MGESRREGSVAVKHAERQTGVDRTEAEAERVQEHTTQAAQRPFERFADLGREGVRQASDVSSAATGGAARSGAAMAECAQEITSAWSRYAEDVMRHTSEASRELLRSRTFSEMLEVQARLLRDNMQAFLDHSVKIAEAASRMTARPFEALQETRTDLSRR